MDEASAIIARARELIREIDLLANDPDEFCKRQGLDPEMLRAARAAGMTPDMRAEVERKFREDLLAVDREVAAAMARDRKDQNPAPRKPVRRARTMV